MRSRFILHGRESRGLSRGNNQTIPHRCWIYPGCRGNGTNIVSRLGAREIGACGPQDKKALLCLS